MYPERFKPGGSALAAGQRILAAQNKSQRKKRDRDAFHKIEAPPPAAHPRWPAAGGAAGLVFAQCRHDSSVIPRRKKRLSPALFFCAIILSAISSASHKK